MMPNIGTVSIVILFSFAFVFYVYDPNYGFGFEELMSAFNNDGITGLLQTIFNSFLSLTSAALIATAVAASIALGRNNSDYVIAALILIGVANLLFVPFTFPNATTALVPEAIQLLVRGFFNLMLVLTAIGFVMGRDL